jgi:hypothetical protein
MAALSSKLAPRVSSVALTFRHPGFSLRPLIGGIGAISVHPAGRPCKATSGVG